MSLLNEIQQKLKAPKNQRNEFGGFNYRSAEDILEAVKPLMGGRGVLVINDEIVNIGARYYVKATAELHAADSPVARATGWAREEETKKGMDAAQITGAASSYARKYALNGLFCIDDTKDADSHDNREAVQNAPVVAKTAPRATEAEIREQALKERIMNNLRRLGKPNSTKQEVAQSVFDTLGVELTPDKYEWIGEELGKLSDKKK